MLLDLIPVVGHSGKNLFLVKGRQGSERNMGKLLWGLWKIRQLQLTGSLGFTDRLFLFLFLGLGCCGWWYAVPSFTLTFWSFTNPWRSFSQRNCRRPGGYSGKWRTTPSRHRSPCWLWLACTPSVGLSSQVDCIGAPDGSSINGPFKENTTSPRISESKMRVSLVN